MSRSIFIWIRTRTERRDWTCSSPFPSSPPMFLLIALFVCVCVCQCVGEEIWVDSRTVYIGHKEPPPGAEAYIPQRYPDNRIVSSKVNRRALIYLFWWWNIAIPCFDRRVVGTIIMLLLFPLWPAVHVLELHPQESVWAVQENRQLLLPGHFSGAGEMWNTAVELWINNPAPVRSVQTVRQFQINPLVIFCAFFFFFYLFWSGPVWFF